MAEEQAAMAQQGGAGGMPPMGGAMPMPTGAPTDGASASSVEDLWMQAEQEAMNIVSLPPEQRRSALINLKKTNESLHALVSANIDKIENDAAMQGKAAMRAGQMAPA
jgi:hypothetical protein